MRSALRKARQAPSSTKARILRNAEEIFAAKGFAGASTREIASKAAVNISSLHYHWESKETLYYAVFQNIYDRIVEVVRASLPMDQRSDGSGGHSIEVAMGALFDFFADHPTIPRLLVRRLVENDEGHANIERDILLPAWQVFAGWTETYGRRKPKGLDAQMFMLTVESVVLFFLLDSRHVNTLLGGSIHSPALRKRVRTYITNLVPTLLRRGAD